MSQRAKTRSKKGKTLPTREGFFHFGVQSLTRSAPCPKQGQFLLIFAPNRTSDQPDPAAAQADKVRNLTSG